MARAACVARVLWCGLRCDPCPESLLGMFTCGSLDIWNTPVVTKVQGSETDVTEGFVLLSNSSCWKEAAERPSQLDLSQEELAPCRAILGAGTHGVHGHGCLGHRRALRCIPGLAQLPPAELARAAELLCSFRRVLGFSELSRNNRLVNLLLTCYPGWAVSPVLGLLCVRVPGLAPLHGRQERGGCEATLPFLFYVKRGVFALVCRVTESTKPVPSPSSGTGCVGALALCRPLRAT